jgi:hypothetical protein
MKGEIMVLNKQVLNKKFEIETREQDVIRELSLFAEGARIAHLRLNLDPDRSLISVAHSGRVGYIETLELPLEDGLLIENFLKELYKVARTDRLEFVVAALDSDQASTLRRFGFELLGQRVYSPQSGWNSVVWLDLKNQKKLDQAHSPLSDLCRFYNGMESIAEFFKPMARPERPIQFEGYDFQGARI